MDVQGTVAAGWEPVGDAFLRNFEQRGERGAAVAVHHDGRRVVDLWAGTRDADAGEASAAADGAAGGVADGESGAATNGSADGSADGVAVGAADDNATGAEPWREETAQVVRSATKGVAAAVPLLLHQRGLLDLDAPVAAYWPEFKAAGKDRVTVRQLLAHRAGVPVLDHPLTLAEAVDLETATRAIAAQAPVWEPDTAHGYHAHTFSWLLS
ncbi:serine hydrolase, partial [Streptomyces sp. SID6041]|nr:serine hydrolase [Streptomyces sp. SID6041]